MIQTKKLLATTTLLSMAVWLSAQITITNASFPAAGDSLKTATDFNPSGIVVSAPGGPFTWDYSQLKASAHQVTVFQPAANGASAANFPSAELVTMDDVGTETYYDVTASAFSVLGISGSGFGGGGFLFGTDIVFTPPSVELHAPLTFPNVYSSSSSFGFSLAVSDLPGGLLDSLGVPTGLFDSIRIKLTISRNDFVDAFGTLKIPGGTYDVLREKRTDYTDTRLEIHVPFIGWTDVTELLGVGGFGMDTTVTYNFLSNTAKEPITVLTMDSTGLVAQEAEFKDNGLPSSTEIVPGENHQVTFSPNPVTDFAVFELHHPGTGHYTLWLYDPQGQLVLSQPFTSSRESVSLKSLQAGMYVFRITDAQQKIFSTGKLLKVNP